MGYIDPIHNRPISQPWTALPEIFGDAISYSDQIYALAKWLLGQKYITPDQYKDVEDKVKQLADKLQAFQEHGFDDYYREQLQAWIDDNFADIMRYALKVTVFFGLTQDGHFVAYRPESWDEIVFDTGADYGSDDYGRLILKYAVPETAVGMSR